MGRKPRPARSLDPCRQPDLFTPFQRGGCVSGTAPASPSWRLRQDVGAEHRNPRLLPCSIRGNGGEKEGGAQGGKGSPHLSQLFFIEKGTSFLHCATPPAAPCAPHPSQGITVGCLIPRPQRQKVFRAVPALLGKRWESEPALEATCPFLVDEVPALQAHGWPRVGAQGPTCWSPSQCPGCPQVGLSRGTHLHCSWDGMFMQDNTHG